MAGMQKSYKNMYILEENKFKQWLETMGRAWTTKDAALAVSIFDKNASYAATPYRDALKGKEEIYEYWAKNMGTQENIKFDFEIVAIKDDYGLAHAWGSYQENEKEEFWDGIFWATFNEEDKCVTWKEWWVTK
jgi:hypothetical protein